MTCAREAVAAGKKLREDILDLMRREGRKTNAEVAAALGLDPEVVRPGISRLMKAGLVRSNRSRGGSGHTTIAHYDLTGATQLPRNVSKPFRPVLKEWAPHGRDPLALPPEFFERTPA